MLNRITNSILYRLRGINQKHIIGQNNKLQIKGRLRGCKIEISGNNNKLIINKGSIISHTHVYIKGNNITIKIGKNVRMKKGTLWGEDNSSKIMISDETTIEDAHIAVTEDNGVITIGKDCMLAKNINIRNGDSHSIIDIQTNKRLNSAKNVLIKDHVWISNNVTILKGTNIQNNSVIASGSIVSNFNSIDESVIIGGIPAKILKTKINWKRERI